MTAQASPWTHDRDDPAEPLAIVGVAVGNLAPLSELIAGLPPGSGLAVVVLAHPPLDLTVPLPECQGENGPLKWTVAGESDRVLPDHLYVPPAGRQLEIVAGKFQLVEPDQPTARLPADRFLCSLALDQPRRAAALLLPGAGDDGMFGAQAILARGGIALAQDQLPTSRERAPRAANEPVAAMPVVPARQLPAVLLRDVERRRQNHASATSALPSGAATDSQVRQQLAERESQLQLLTNALPVLIAYLDRNEQYQFANEQYERWFGLPANEILGKSTREVVGEEAYALVEESIRKVLAGFPTSVEQRLPYRHGGARDVHIDYVPHHVGDEVVGYYLLVQDISERKANAEAIQRSEREYRAIFELAGSGYALTDLRTKRFARVNQRFCEITGYDEAELLTIFFPEITHPDDREADLALQRPVFAGQRQYWTNEKRYIRKDGSVIWVMVSGTLLRDEQEQPWRTVATIQDVTKRHLAEVALRESEDRFRTMADNIAQLAWMTDGTGAIFWYNRRWFEYSGTTLEQMKGWGWQQIHHPDHVERVVEKFRRHLAQGEPWEDTFPLRGKDGMYRWFLSRAFPIKDEQGAVLRWFGTNTDITERMQMEQALKEADRRKDEFLATLAHELRNPLAPIRTGLELLQLSGDDPQIGKQVLPSMRRQTDQLVRLVDDLMDVSRITRGKVALQRSLTPLADVLDTALEAVRPHVDEQQHELRVSLPSEPIYLNADPTRLAQVFTNLLANAVKYTEQAGRIELSAARRGDQLEVRVKDPGIGIAPEMLENIFELFSQAESSPSRPQNGLGIGLTLVRSLIEMHGGAIRAESEGLGRGSEFIVSLPLPAAADQVSSAEQPAAAGPATPRRVLVVDDNGPAADSLKLLLEAYGHQATVAYSGLAALECGPRFAPEVILLDLGMPDMDGFETARQIREADWGRRPLLVALTGWGQESDRLQTEAAGFDRHVVKPIDTELLLELLTAAEPAARDR